MTQVRVTSLDLGAIERGQSILGFMEVTILGRPRDAGLWQSWAKKKAR